MMVVDQEAMWRARKGVGVLDGRAGRLLTLAREMPFADLAALVYGAGRER